ncbi:MAG: phosphoribosyl-AMP cyclohydrolase [Erythrobacter sp.]
MATSPDISTAEREHGTQLAPRFDAAGLIAAVVCDATSGEVLVVAFMNEEALARTIKTKLVHFWSRSRKSLWMKGETSRNTLRVQEMRIDCDQDAVVIRAIPAGPICHTGARGCFYRRVDLEGDEPILTPVA